MLDLFFKIIILELDSSRRPSAEYLCFMCQSAVSFGLVGPACASQLTQPQSFQTKMLYMSQEATVQLDSGSCRQKIKNVSHAALQCNSAIALHSGIRFQACNKYF